MHPDLMPPAVPCLSCGVPLTCETGACPECGGLRWTHVNDSVHGSQADRDTEDTIWHCQAARCESGHVIQRVRSDA